LQTAVETLLFFHPAVWWIGSVIRSERENCCDDLALASGAAPLSYARALPAPALSALGGSLPQRVRRLVLPRERCRAGWSVSASILPLLSGMAVAVPLSAAALTCKTAGEPDQAPPAAQPMEEVEETPEPLVENDHEEARPPQDTLSIHDLVRLSSVGVTEEYMQEMRALFG